MQARAWKIMVLSALFVQVLAQPAVAGGVTFFDWERQHYGVGEVARGHEGDVFFRSIAAADRALVANNFYVYLAPHFHYRELKRGVEDDWVLAGRALLSPSRLGTNLVRVEAQFEIPQVPPGRYTAVFCDLGCETPLGDLYPTPFTILSSPLEAQLMPHLLQLRRGLGRRLGAEAREIRTEIRDVETRIYTVDGSTDDEIAEARAGLSARIDRLTAAQSGRDFTGEAALWFVGGALFMLLMVVTARKFMAPRPRRSSAQPGERPQEAHRDDPELTAVP